MEQSLTFWKEQERKAQDTNGHVGSRSTPAKLHGRHSPKPVRSARPPVPRPSAFDDSELLRSRSQLVRSRGETVAELANKLDLMLTPPPTPTRVTPASSLERKVGTRSSWMPPNHRHRDSANPEQDEVKDTTKDKLLGFTSYLDGPVDRPSLQKSHSISAATGPRKSRHPSLKVTQSASMIPRNKPEVFKSPKGPERDYLTPSVSQSEEVSMFWDMVRGIAQQLCPHAEQSLESPVIAESLHRSPWTSKGSRRGTVSLSNRGLVTVAVETRRDVPPTVFKCDVDSTIEDVVKKVLNRTSSRCTVADNYLLKVCGRDEFLHNSRLLSDYEYVYQCLKVSSDVKLVLLDKSSFKPSFPQKTHVHVATPPMTSTSGVMQQELNTLLNSYFSKDEHFRHALDSDQQLSSPMAVPTLAQSVISCVQLLCERLSFIEPPEVTEAVFNLRRACKSATQFDLVTSLVSVEGISAETEWIDVGSDMGRPEGAKDILSALDLLQRGVQHLVSVYCASYLPGFRPLWDSKGGVSLSTDSTFRVKVSALHRLPQTEFRSYDMFQVEACVFCSGKALSRRVYSPPAKTTRSFFPTVVWDKWLNLGIRLSHLPREARVCFTLNGLRMPGSSHQWSRIPIAWVAHRLFSSSGVLVGGVQLLGLWTGEGANPLDSTYSSLQSRSSPILQVTFEGDSSWQFSDVKETNLSRSAEVRPNVLHVLKTIAQRDRFSSLSSEEQRLMWENRWLCPSHLSVHPRGLPALLLSTPHWHGDTLSQVWAVLQTWPYSEPTFGLELLLPQFADSRVRAKSVEWLSQLRNDDLVDMLPQLVQSLRYDCYVHSPMAKMLLSRAATSPRIAHHLFWHFRLLSGEVKFSERYSQLLSALQSLCGEVLRAELAKQVELVEQLCAIATEVKAARDAHRQTTLVRRLKQLSQMFTGCIRLPLNPSLQVWGINIEACSFFNSNTVPLKLVFCNGDPFGSPVQFIFKHGDDLRQDALILQLLRVMEKIWLRAGLDLKLVTYQCIPTGPEEGMLEFVPGAETLRAIQTQHGLTGSFKDKPLSEWLRRHNPTDSQYTQAVENFTVSCAGYCVATYALGICDRHNDNIMVKKSGHMFHIDFSKILGNAQMFGSIRRDRAPFVLTPDMAYVINDGDNLRFRRFVELCCSAYNELRRHSNLFISLLSLMLSNNLPEVASADDVQYVRDALMVGRTENEATYAFTKHIEASLGSLATQINFFIHNIAQMKFSSSGGSTGLLSLSPNTYSIATDGKIHSVQILAFHKRFYPETFYVYEVEVTREDCTLPKSVIFRRYREFDELHAKLSQLFPLVPLPQLPGKIYMPGKSHTKQTSEKRQVELQRFLQSLLRLPPRVSECDVVYTFLHCLPRDEQDMARMEEEDISSQLQNSGKVKVRLLYQEEQQTLSVTIEDVKGLVPREGSETANPYVKLYLLPDSDKATKRKTKVIRNTLNPRYQDTFVYVQLSWSALLRKTLQLSVWDASSLLSNQCLAVTCVQLAEVDALSTGVEQTFVLQRPCNL